MPIDRDRALGAVLPESTSSWAENDVILYHLGVGAGAAPTDPAELSYCYEANLKVLPTYATTLPFELIAHLGSVDGLDFNFAMLLHGEQDLHVHRPLPTAATVSHRGSDVEIWDKGKGALVVLEVVTTDENNDRLFTNRYSVFLRGEGGFGGPGGPTARNVAPEREPDLTVESETLPQQALLYRLSGDKNPLHADPNFAALGGFDRPILHGLCSFGIACKAVVDGVLGGEVTRVERYQGRFTGPVFPGETLVTSVWKDGDTYLLSVATKERQTPVLSNAALSVKGKLDE